MNSINGKHLVSLNHRFLLLGVSLLVAKSAMACEPVVPFMQVMVPALALSGSILVLIVAVVLKSVLFAIFERRLPRLRAAWRMFLGNVLTSFVGLTIGVAIDSQISNLYFRLYFRPSILLSDRPMPHHPFHKTTRRILHSKHIRALHVLQRPPLHPLQLRIS